jgi:hypothetical protein
MSQSGSSSKPPIPSSLKPSLEQAFKDLGLLGAGSGKSGKDENNEYCPVVLWHGTSAHLLPIMKAHGLGGRNVLEDWKAFEFLQWAFEAIGDWDRYDYSNPNLSLLVTISAALGKKGAMNFEYGDLYATGQYQKAANYSRGPEVLDLIRLAIKLIDKQKQNLLIKKLEQYPEIKRFLSLPPKPIVLKLPHVLIANLSLENGDELPEYLISDIDQSKGLWEIESFRVTTTIPFEDIVEIHQVPYSPD